MSTILKISITLFSIVLCFFTIEEVNYNWLQPQSALAVFVGLGLALCFLQYPAFKRWKDAPLSRGVDWLLAATALIVCGYVVVQSEPVFKPYWLAPQQEVSEATESVEGDSQAATSGVSLGDRAGGERQLDFVLGLIGLLLVLEATRRSIGWIVPALALAFVVHSYYCYGSIEFGWPQLPGWLLPHRGQDVNAIVSTTFLQSLGVFGQAATVMFKYVFLFVIFGSFLEMSGATQFIIDFAESVFGKSPGGPAKVSVLGSGLMGSLSGSAVANAVTTGTFTIPMMRNAGFSPSVAGGITAAAASGGALVPPVMGAGAYMMLELVQPEVKFLQVAKAAIIPAILYYLSIYLIVHFFSRKLIETNPKAAPSTAPPLSFGESVRDLLARTYSALCSFEAVVFIGALGTLIPLLIMGKSPFRAVTGSLIAILLLTALRPKLKLGTVPRILALVVFAAATLGHHFAFADPEAPSAFDSWLGSLIRGMDVLLLFGLIHAAWRPGVVDALVKSARNGVSLVAASACVGIIIGIVQQTGIANDFSVAIKGVVSESLLLALVGIMCCSIVLGMGVPSVVCYLLMATLMGDLLSKMGVIPLAAHFFIFYFGMMSMVTPPVALAAYASASIAEAPIMKTAWAAFRFSLAGFTLPYMFVYRPELLLLSESPEGLTVTSVVMAVVPATLGIVALSAGIAGFYARPLSVFVRALMLFAAGLLLFPGQGIDVGGVSVPIFDVTGIALLAAVMGYCQFGPRRAPPTFSPTVQEKD